MRWEDQREARLLFCGPFCCQGQSCELEAWTLELGCRCLTTRLRVSQSGHSEVAAAGSALGTLPYGMLAKYEKVPCCTAVTAKGVWKLPR